MPPERGFFVNECFRLSELQTKDVINVRDGKNLGRICDMEMDADHGRILRLMLPGRPRFFGFFGREESVEISWENIRLIGLDVILVDLPVLLCVENERIQNHSRVF